MNRKYSPEKFIHSAEQVRKAVPDCALTTDVICGFPGETDEDFGKTFELVEKLRIPFIHAFPFSPRPGTKAASFFDNVPHRVKKERVSILREIAEDNRNRFAGAFVGIELAAALESSWDTCGNIMGLTDNYLRVAVKQDGAVLKPGRIAGVMIEGHDGDVLSGYSTGTYPRGEDN